MSVQFKQLDTLLTHMQTQVFASIDREDADRTANLL
jgi:hypothetical protein